MHPASLSLLLVSNLAYVFTTQQTPQFPAHSPTTLNAQRDHTRVLLVFAPAASDQRLQQQVQALRDQQAASTERNLLLIPIVAEPSTLPPTEGDDIGYLSAHDQTAARHRFHIAPHDFTVVLLGKDGGEKLRASSPVSFDRLRTVIDAMPMRQNEMQHRATPQ